MAIQISGPIHAQCDTLEEFTQLLVLLAENSYVEDIVSQDVVNLTVDINVAFIQENP